MKLNFNAYFNKNTYANRGMNLEHDINQTNAYYDLKNIAIIYKKPTPIKVVNVEYPSNKIKEAYFNEPSTLDYTGIYKKYYLEFDAKETKSNTSFPISNIHNHQLKHIEKVIQHGGITFLIIRFSSLNINFLLPGENLINFINNNTRKSIPLEYFEKYSNDIYAQGHPGAFGFKLSPEQLTYLMNNISSIEPTEEEKPGLTAGNMTPSEYGKYHITSMDEFKRQGYLWRIAIGNSKVTSNDEIYIRVKASDVVLKATKGKLFIYDVLGMECKAFSLLEGKYFNVYAEYTNEINMFIRQS